METAGEGGPYGMALLAAYCLHRTSEETLVDYLNRHVFMNAESTTILPDSIDENGFSTFLRQYQTALKAERAIIENM